MTQSREKDGKRTRHSIAASRNEEKEAVFSRLPGALARAAFVVLLIVMPSALLPGGPSDNGLVVTLVALFGALFTLVEYTAASPSIVEFRSAPPFNRVRFSALFITIFLLTLVYQDTTNASDLSRLMKYAVSSIGASTDFPFSPVRLMLLMMPENSTPQQLSDLRAAAGLSYLISLTSIVVFVALLRLRRWPRRTGTFNVWINLPTFDPTAGGDVVERLNRDSQVNIILGFLLPFMIPAVVKLTQALIGPLGFDDLQSLIWMVAAWAFLPASLLMRGVALNRVAQLIQVQRKRAYEQAVADGMLPA